MKLGPRPTGRPWMPAEDEQLLALLDSRMDKDLIARRLKRTVQAVRTRKYVLNKCRLGGTGAEGEGREKITKKWGDPQLDAAEFAMDKFFEAQAVVAEAM